MIGYIPTGYFPTSIVVDKDQKQLVVADDKGIGTHVLSRSANLFRLQHPPGYRRGQSDPGAERYDLAGFSKQVFNNNH